MQRRQILRLASTLALPAAALRARAQGAPVRLLVGYAAGGPVDMSARLVAPVLARELGQPVIVENRPGASGAVAGAEVSKGAPNALTLFYAASPTMTITPHLLKPMPFDPVQGVTPVAPILSYANVLVINKDAPFKTLPELVAHAKANPGKLAYGSAGVGASNHLSGELLALRTGTQLQHVPYKGNAPAMTDVIGGQIAMMFDIVGGAKSYISSGRVRPVAVTSRERNPGLPDVPSLRELGVPDYEVGGWYAIFGPPRMNAEWLQRLNEAARRALADEALKAKLLEQGYEIWSGAPSLVSERAARELALWSTVTKDLSAQ